jgi:hypothetical protein
MGWTSRARGGPSLAMALYTAQIRACGRSLRSDRRSGANHSAQPDFRFGAAGRVAVPSLGDSSTVEQRTLTPLI